MDLSDGVRAIYQNLTVTDEPIQHRYEKPGFYRVSVKAENSAGHDQATLYIRVTCESCHWGWLSWMSVCDLQCIATALLFVVGMSFLLLVFSSSAGSPSGSGAHCRKETGSEPDCCGASWGVEPHCLLLVDCRGVAGVFSFISSALFYFHVINRFFSQVPSVPKMLMMAGPHKC